jgi:hypothetical protein
MEIAIKSDYPARSRVRALFSDIVRHVQEGALALDLPEVRTGDRLLMYGKPVATVLAVIPVTITRPDGEVGVKEECPRFPLAYWTVGSDDSLTPYLSLYNGRSEECEREGDLG